MPGPALGLAPNGPLQVAFKSAPADLSLCYRVPAMQIIQGIHPCT